MDTVGGIRDKAWGIVSNKVGAFDVNVTLSVKVGSFDGKLEMLKAGLEQNPNKVDKHVLNN
ncbi:hypothetical protein FRX31_027333 [Thalictrum thalictroides]|uniref:Uncharacterized protein n=1 Tax=Thalictrum thalictroides TaxID=46969 RepID=A0A7J6VEN2_THATH|nr:hypothetical protein FRX31_027333 [Thalictrum thalictroides]